MDMQRKGTPFDGDEVAGIRLPKDRLTLLFLVMLVTAAGNTAMQSVMPSIGTRLQVPDFWISLAYSWSAVLWMIMAPGADRGHHALHRGVARSGHQHDQEQQGQAVFGKAHARLVVARI